MTFQGDPIRAAVALAALVVGAFTVLSRLWLFGELKSRGAALSFPLSTTFGYLEYQYLKCRESIGDARLDRIAVFVVLAPLVTAGLLLVLFGV
ncbi:MAG: hypothetical protein K8H90_07495 [Thermoanaerobaculia bacterium]|nr:hypothetical protein [Thermoanaerobaculia bacterium]